MNYNDIEDWETLAPGTELDNKAVRAPDHRTLYAEWSYVAVSPTVAKITLLSFQHSPINQRLAVESRNGAPSITSSGFKAKISLVEHAVLNMDRTGAISMASLILAMAFSEDEAAVQGALASQGLELKRV